MEPFFSAIHFKSFAQKKKKKKMNLKLWLIIYFNSSCKFLRACHLGVFIHELFSLLCLCLTLLQGCLNKWHFLWVLADLCKATVNASCIFVNYDIKLRSNNSFGEHSFSLPGISANRFPPQPFLFSAVHFQVFVCLPNLRKTI